MNVAPRIQSFCCPTCRGYIGEAAPLDKVAELITSDQQRYVFDALAKKPGENVGRVRLYKAMYGHRGALPANPSHGFANLISALRAKLEPHGWMIECTNGARRGGRAVYRLLPIGGER